MVDAVLGVGDEVGKEALDTRDGFLLGIGGGAVLRKTCGLLEGSGGGGVDDVSVFEAR